MEDEMRLWNKNATGNNKVQNKKFKYKGQGHKVNLAYHLKVFN